MIRKSLEHSTPPALDNIDKLETDPDMFTCNVKTDDDDLNIDFRKTYVYPEVDAGNLDKHTDKQSMDELYCIVCLLTAHGIVQRTSSRKRRYSGHRHISSQRM